MQLLIWKLLRCDTIICNLLNSEMRMRMSYRKGNLSENLIIVIIITSVIIAGFYLIFGEDIQGIRHWK